ncbi:MAG: S41 family peptidase [Fimbriimonadaceae bacterium]|nr:S41 family peptidase [Fimbriimonadaceae bacterium]
MRTSFAGFRLMRLAAWLGVLSLGAALSAQTLSPQAPASRPVILDQAPAAAAQPTAPGALTAEDREKIVQAAAETIKRMAFVPGVDFNSLDAMLAEVKPDLDKAETPTALAGVVNRALQKFGFSHISLFPPEFGERRITQQRAGIGIMIQIEEGGLRVTDLFPDSPAVKAGLQPGDLIFESDGRPVRAVGDLSGEKGQQSRIKLRRNEEVLEFTVTRDTYRTVIPETLRWEGEDVAVVKIPTFDQGYSRDNVDRIMAEASRAKMIVLDLRNNGGGMVLNLQHLMGHFLDRRDQPLGTFIGRMAVQEFERTTGRKAENLAEVAEATTAKVRAFSRREVQPYAGRVTVLINGASGSASEMAAAALRDHRQAKLIGERSAGAVLASMILPLRDAGGFWIQVPITDYVTIRGRRLEGNGLEPDIAAKLPRFGEPDEAVAKAVGLLKETASRN